MHKEIELLDFEGEKRKVSMLANAMTAVRYRQVFKQDLMREFGTMMKADGMTDAEATEFLGEKIEIFQRLAYVMNSSAMKKDMSKLSIEDYYEWLEPFDAMTFYENGQEIAGVYMGQRKASSKSKKKNAPQRES